MTLARASVDILRELVNELAELVGLDEGGPAIRSSLTNAASEGWYRYGDSNPGPVAENHVS